MSYPLRSLREFVHCFPVFMSPCLDATSSRETSLDGKWTCVPPYEETYLELPLASSYFPLSVVTICSCQ